MLAVLRILLGLAAGALAAPFVGNEVRAPRLLDPQPDSELATVCKACRHPLRPAGKRWVHVDPKVLRGHCSSCGNTVPKWAAWTEIATVLVSGLIAWRIQEWSWLPAFLGFGFVLVAVVLIDARLHLIPTKLVYPAAAVSVVLLSFAALVTHDLQRLKWAVVGGLGASLFLWVLVIVSPKGMGQGDARLCLLLGCFLGWYGWRHVVWGLFGGFFFGSLGGLLLMARRRGGRKALIAFGPYLSAGALLFTLWPHLLDRFLVVG